MQKLLRTKEAKTVGVIALVLGVILAAFLPDSMNLGKIVKEKMNPEQAKKR